MPDATKHAGPRKFFSAGDGSWQERLAGVIETIRDMSSQTEPQALVAAYSRRVWQIVPSDRFCAISRRELEKPHYRITRSDLWKQPINPWMEREKLPLFSGGMFAELIWGDVPVIINDLKFSESDPAAEYMRGMKSLVAVPNYDEGHALNMVILMRHISDGYDPEQLPEHVWMSNLFGRATHSLVMAQQVKDAYKSVETELQVVADIQRSLLPAELPTIPGVALAADYQTSRHAGGDYYDFFPLPDGKWGILIADVSGHGTPAAVIMAVTHSIAHTHEGAPTPPSNLMNFVNKHLAARYTKGNGTFVTAFYGILDPARREFTFACAGHPAPRVRHANGNVETCHCARGGLPLGIEAEEQYCDYVTRFDAGDVVTFFTDGITEARRSDGEMFGMNRLDEVLKRCDSASGAVAAVRDAVAQFREKAPPNDDQTLVAAGFM